MVWLGTEDFKLYCYKIRVRVRVRVLPFETEPFAIRKPIIGQQFWTYTQHVHAQDICYCCPR